MNTEELIKIIPEFELIEDADLRERSAKAMLQAMNEGGWQDKNITKCPIELDTRIVNCPINYIDYTRMMTGVCYELYQSYGEWINNMNKCIKDYVIAGSLLQGIGKFIEYSIDSDGKPCRSEKGKLFRYPWLGAYIAMENGLPKEVVHIIVSTSDKYSPGKGKVFKSPESILVKNAELICLGIIYNLYA